MTEKEQIVFCAKELRLPVMESETEEFISVATTENWSYRTFICRLLEREKEVRIENRRRQRVRMAGFPELKYVNQIVRDDLPKDAQLALPELECLNFIKEGRIRVFYGNPGTVKTDLSIAFGIKACL